MCRFEDPVLVQRIVEDLQGLQKKLEVMQKLGLALPGGELDPWQSSPLLQAFEFSCTALQSTQAPSVVLLNSMMLDCMKLKASFLSRDDMFDILRAAVPDFLKERTGRTALPRARWKELWTTGPSSVAQMEQLLAKLVEQAVWFAALEARALALTVVRDAIKGDEGDVAFEPWME